MPDPAVVVVSDAHLGHAPRETTEAFHRFLGVIPRFAGHLVVNGDLFDFWFEYRRVISRKAFPTLAALLQLRKAGVELTVTGGNHDRWGDDFWASELGATFYPQPVELPLLGFRTFLAHGDGLAESRTASVVMHRLTKAPVTVRLFRLIHPDLGYWLADKMSAALAEKTRDSKALDAAAAAQAEYARGLLNARPDLDLVLLSHTHRAQLVPVASRRWFVNPGGWMDGRCYALLTPSGPELRVFREP